MAKIAERAHTVPTINYNNIVGKVSKEAAALLLLGGYKQPTAKRNRVFLAHRQVRIARTNTATPRLQLVGVNPQSLGLKRGWTPNYTGNRFRYTGDDLAATLLLVLGKLTNHEASDTGAEIRAYKKRVGNTSNASGQAVILGKERFSTGPLLEEAYPRASPEALKIITPHHKKLSNSFCRWLKKHHRIEGIQEQNQTDIHFRCKTQNVLAELKVCYGLDTRHAVREAVGQLLEYNHYPRRFACDSWLIVLDTKPSVDDLTFIEALRHKLSLPLFLGWQIENRFSFHPKWGSS
jgi:hypothetical protein